MLDRRSILTGVCLAAFATCEVEAVVLDAMTDAKSFRQTKDWSCWAAAAVILLRWKNKGAYSELDVAKMAGRQFEDAFNNDTGISGEQFAAFAAALRLKTEAPQNFTPAGYNKLIKAHGPLWIGSRLDKGTANSRRHIRVLRGVTGDGSFGGSTAWILDPDKGRDYQSTMTKFAAELEQIAREEIGSGNDLFPQVIRFP